MLSITRISILYCIQIYYTYVQGLLAFSICHVQGYSAYSKRVGSSDKSHKGSRAGGLEWLEPPKSKELWHRLDCTLECMSVQPVNYWPTAKPMNLWASRMRKDDLHIAARETVDQAES